MFKSLNEATTPAEMRAAIEQGAYGQNIIRRVLSMARRDGMSAEDTYSALAYYALQSMIQTQRDYAAVLATMPMPPMVLMDGGSLPVRPPSAAKTPCEHMKTRAIPVDPYGNFMECTGCGWLCDQDDLVWRPAP